MELMVRGRSYSTAGRDVLVACNIEHIPRPAIVELGIWAFHFNFHYMQRCEWEGGILT